MDSCWIWRARPLIWLSARNLKGLKTESERSPLSQPLSLLPANLVGCGSYEKQDGRLQIFKPEVRKVGLPPLRNDD